MQAPDTTAQSKLPMALSVPLLLIGLSFVSGCHDNRRAEAARVPDATQAPPPLPEDAPAPGSQAAEAAGSPAPATPVEGHR